MTIREACWTASHKYSNYDHKSYFRMAGLTRDIIFLEVATYLSNVKAKTSAITDAK